MKIKTKAVYPPIPCRDYDWCAWHEEFEERDWLAWAGWGASEKEAIADLERIDRERAEAEIEQSKNIPRNLAHLRQCIAGWKGEP